MTILAHMKWSKGKILISGVLDCYTVKLTFFRKILLMLRAVAPFGCGNFPLYGIIFRGDNNGRTCKSSTNYFNGHSG